MRYAMAAFPLVGAVIGALWCVCGLLPLPNMLKAAGFLPDSRRGDGGIHLDGLRIRPTRFPAMADREKKLANSQRPALRRVRGLSALCGYFSAVFRAPLPVLSL